MTWDLQASLWDMQQRLAWLRGQADALHSLVSALASVVRQLRAAGDMLFHPREPDRPALSYETLWLDLVLDLQDARGSRAVLTRTQRVRFLAPDGAVLRELLWGSGEQLLHYSIRGARRLRVRREGSKRAILLDPDQRPARGDELTITSRRTIRGAFREREEYCESFLERPTGRLSFTVLFPRRRPPRAACLVSATTEQVLRTLHCRYGPDGRAVLRCRLHKPATGVTYSLRWSW